MSIIEDQFEDLTYSALASLLPSVLSATNGQLFNNIEEKPSVNKYIDDLYAKEKRNEFRVRLPILKTYKKSSSGTKNSPSCTDDYPYEIADFSFDWFSQEDIASITNHSSESSGESIDLDRSSVISDSNTLEWPTEFPDFLNNYDDDTLDFYPNFEDLVKPPSYDLCSFIKVDEFSSNVKEQSVQTEECSRIIEALIESTNNSLGSGLIKYKYFKSAANNNLIFKRKISDRTKRLEQKWLKQPYDIKTMANKCSFANCRKNINGSWVRKFCFPIHNPDRCRQWIVNSGNPVLAELKKNVLVKLLVCGNHFRDTDFVNDQLKPDAVPIHFKHKAENIPPQTTNSNFVL